MHQLRPYQSAATDAIISAIRKDTAPIMIEAATGAGKSLIVAEVARIIHEMTGKRILCLAPSAELVVQNREKYLATGNPASMFSASAGAKSLRHPVVFGSPLTVKNRISAFQSQFAMVVIDECHGLTPTVRAIIDAMRQEQPNLRIVGMTATPYRLGSGYIFAQWPDDRFNGEDRALDPYFSRCVYRITAPTLIEQGYLTPPRIGAIHAGGYETHGLVPNRAGKFDAQAVDRAYHGHGRKTAAIVADVVAQAQGCHGVLLYAATIQHAQEVLASLPPEMSAIITADTPDRTKILERFKAMKIKYIVNVGVLTTGFDAPHVDLIAILRKTESVGLLQQIIGRGLRLFDGKTDCLILDYTSNIEDHCPDGDLFTPNVKAKSSGGTGAICTAECPECGYENEFTWHVERTDYKADKNGYALDVFGERVIPNMPVHYGRRCMGLVSHEERCGYRWAGKECVACGEVNDIAARYCYACKAEIVDPNEKLAADFKAMKRDPTQPQTDEVLSMAVKEGVSRAGNRTVRVDWVTPFRQFSTWLQPDGSHPRARKEWDAFVSATGAGESQPDTISYVRNIDDQFYRILGYNREADAVPCEHIEVKLNQDDGSHVCNSCGGPRSKYSSGVCKECYTTKAELRRSSGNQANDAIEKIRKAAGA